jgi:hypothetical protein
MSPETYSQIENAYHEMVKTARYRPGAPDDGFGNLIDEKAPITQDEIEGYAGRWWKQEDDCTFWVGCCNFSTRAATMFAIEAAHNMCGAADRTALRLLKMAVRELERVIREEQ